MSDDDFLSRWSRRKRAVLEESPPEPAAPVEEPAANPEVDEDEAAILARFNLPLPETMQPGDDFSAFMAKGVPAFLRKRALRVLWRSNPVLANLDGLNDYDDDFTSPELTQKVLATAYQVGRGFVSKASEIAEPEEVAEEPEVAAEEPVSKDEEPVSYAENREADSQPEAEPPVRPRRMRFES